MKRLRFADNEESSFEAWKPSHMGFAALLYSRFADVQELRFHGAKSWNMGSAVQQWVWFADAQESRIQFWNFQILKVPTLKNFDFLMLRNRIFRLGNVHIWAVPNCMLVYSDCQEWFFQPSKRSNMHSALLVGGRFDDIQEFFFQAGKRLDMNCAELQELLLADCQEWCIVSEKFSEKSSTFM